ncbi:MAG: type II toxin-antitoxin system YafQ family toxin [Candidatus Vogelbacteria bacterium]|nr:type II toxin-antitoxin system YafQ family toxin [Candidatus Vogelbacteria bacterium]
MIYGIVTTKQYRKAFRRFSGRKNFKLGKLNEIIAILQSGKPLPENCRDHRLNGYLQQFRECHIAPDVLLVYEIKNEILILVLVNMGSHVDLFGL